jgi:hypothetical protein
MDDIDSDDVSVLTADSAATAVRKDQIAAAEPQVVEDEQSETPTILSVEALRKKETHEDHALALDLVLGRGVVASLSG